MTWVSEEEDRCKYISKELSDYLGKNWRPLTRPRGLSFSQGNLRYINVREKKPHFLERVIFGASEQALSVMINYEIGCAEDCGGLWHKLHTEKWNLVAWEDTLGLVSCALSVKNVYRLSKGGASYESCAWYGSIHGYAPNRGQQEPHYQPRISTFINDLHMLPSHLDTLITVHQERERRLSKYHKVHSADGMDLGNLEFNGRCNLCGDTINQQGMVCAACSGRMHAECWRYLGSPLAQDPNVLSSGTPPIITPRPACPVFGCGCGIYIKEEDRITF